MKDFDICGFCGNPAKLISPNIVDCKYCKANRLLIEAAVVIADASEIFRTYSEKHKAKHTEDGNTKAKANYQEMLKLQEFLVNYNHFRSQNELPINQAKT
jgi:hypothetical protein